MEFRHEAVTREDDIKRFIDVWHELTDIVVIKPTMLLQHRPDIQNFATEQTGYDGDETLRYIDLTEDRFERTAPCFETSRRLPINSDGDVWCGHHLSEDFGPSPRTPARPRDVSSERFRRSRPASLPQRPACGNCRRDAPRWGAREARGERRRRSGMRRRRVPAGSNRQFRPSRHRATPMLLLSFSESFV